MRESMQMYSKRSALSVALCALSALSVFGCGADDDDGGGAGMAAVGGGGASGGGAAGGVAAVSGGVSMGCGSESFAAIYTEIFSKTEYMCTNPACHGRMPGQTVSVGNLELMTKDLAYTDLVGVASDSVLCGDAPRTRVVKGNAAMSLLVQKLRGDTIMCGAVMPPTGSPITDAELMRISSWINAGACNN